MRRIRIATETKTKWATALTAPLRPSAASPQTQLRHLVFETCLKWIPSWNLNRREGGELNYIYLARNGLNWSLTNSSLQHHLLLARMRTSFGVLRVKFPLIIWRITVLKRLRLLSNLVGFAFLLFRISNLEASSRIGGSCTLQHSLLLLHCEKVVLGRVVSQRRLGVCGLRRHRLVHVRTVVG